MPDTLSCPTCGRPVLLMGVDRPLTFPFCCSRCRDRDLGAWFAGKHAIAGEDLEQVDRSASGVDRPPVERDPRRSAAE